MSDGLAPAYLVVGDDAFLVSEAIGEALAAVPDLCIEEFGPGTDVGHILESLRTPSMLGDRRVVVVRDLDHLPAEAHRQLASYLDDPDPGAVLVLVAAKAPPRMAAAMRKVGRVLEVPKGRRPDLLAWLAEQARRKGLTTSAEALAALIEALGEERMALVQGLDELVLALGPRGRLAVEDVRLHFSGRADAQVFGFIDAVAGRRSGQALEALHRLLRRGEPAQRLFWALSGHFRQLLLVGDRSPRELAQALGFQHWRAEKLARQAKGFTPASLIDAYQLLAEADRKMKRSEEPELLTLERAVVAIADGRDG